MHYVAVFYHIMAGHVHVVVILEFHSNRGINLRIVKFHSFEWWKYCTADPLNAELKSQESIHLCIG